MNRLQKVAQCGQAIWLDYIHRNLFSSGDLQRLIDEDGLRGMTSNPSIFEQAIGRSTDYDRRIRELADSGQDIQAIYETLAIADVQTAADTFRPLYDRTQGEHGLVSLEVNPHLAHDTQGTIEEARRLWKALDRPNVMIKVPGTRAGLPALTELIGEGINVNVTLLFGLSRYHEVTDAYVAGVEERLRRGAPVSDVRSVASFFLSRIDVLIDPLLQEISRERGDQAELAGSLLGQAAIASAKVAFRIYSDVVGGERWKKLAAAGAWPQWLLWASTSTKNPQYSDVRYVEPLIGPETINTLPLETLDAYRDHGDPQSRLEHGVAGARDVLANLAALKINIDQLTQQLEDEGVAKFQTAFDQLLKTLKKKTEDAQQAAR